MRVLIVTSSYPSVKAPYNGVFVRDHALALQEGGVEVGVLAPRIYREDPVSALDHGLAVRRFLFWSAQKLLSEYRSIPVARTLTYLVSGVVAAWLTCRRTKPVLLHAHFIIPTGLIAVLAGRYLCRLPVVVTAHCLDVALALSGSRLALACARFTLDRADRVIAVSQALRDDLVERLGCDPDKIDVVPMGVDTGLFRPGDRAASGSRLNLPPGSRTVLFVGGLTEVKGVRDLVDAMPAILRVHPDARFVLAGQGPLEEALLRRATELGVSGRMSLVGTVAHTDVPEWMNAADVLVLPSYDEGLPVCLMEAAAVGLPVVATDVGGSAEIVALGASSLSVQPGDVVALSDAVSRVLSVPQPGLRESDLPPSSRYSERTSVRRIIATYRSVATR